MEPTESDLRQIFMTMIDGYYRADREGRCIMGNPAAFAMVGYTPDELIGKPLVNIWDQPAEREVMLAKMAENGGQLNDYELMLVRKDGRRIVVSINSRFIFDDNGEPAGVEGYVRDVTERWRSEEELRRSEEKLRTIFNHLLDVYYRTDRDGHIVMVSPSARDLLGYSPDELYGRHLDELYLGTGTYDMLVERLHEEEGVVYGFENSLRRKDGREIWTVASSQFYCDEQGQLAGIEGILKDITGHKTAEEELRKANRELEAFSYSVSHDLQGPLRAINGYSAALREDYGDALDGPAHHYLDRIRRATVRMSELIDGLLMLSRVFRTELVPVTVDVTALAGDIMQQLREREPARDLIFEAEPGLKATGDPTLLRLVFHNLLHNAWKFTARAAAARITLEQIEDGGERVFVVRDNGVGFEMEYVQKLFRPFERLHGSDEFEGTGIGLATVRRIIERHGGLVWADGSPNGGASIYFTLGRMKPEGWGP